MKRTKERMVSGRYVERWENDPLFDEWITIKTLHDEEGVDYAEIGQRLAFPRSESYVRFVGAMVYNPDTEMLE